MLEFPRMALVTVLALVAVLGESRAQPGGSPVGDFDDVSQNDFVLDHRDLVIRDGAGRVRLRLDSESGDIRVLDNEGETVALIEQRGRNLWLGGNGRAGDFVLIPRGRTGQSLGNASVHIDGTNATQALGGAGTRGRLVLRDGEGRQRILLNGGTGDLVLGQEGRDGDVFVRNEAGEETATIDGADGTIRAGRIIAERGGAGGIDSASLYLESRDPSIGLRDTTGGNERGWHVQSASNGALIFAPGTTTGLDGRAFVLRPNGGVCIGAC